MAVQEVKVNQSKTQQKAQSQRRRYARRRQQKDRHQPVANHAPSSTTAPNTCSCIAVYPEEKTVVDRIALSCDAVDTWDCNCTTGEFYPEEDNVVKGVTLRCDAFDTCEFNCMDGELYSDADNVLTNFTLPCDAVDKDFWHGVDESAEHDLLSGDFYRDHDAELKRGIIFGNSIDTCTDDVKSLDFFDMDAPATKGTQGIKFLDAIDSCKGLESCLEVLTEFDEDPDTCVKKQDFEPELPLKSAAEGNKIVVIFADYDGCFDIISPSNLPGSKMDKMFDYAKQIDRQLHPRSHAEDLLTDYLRDITADADEVILFSGSNRQSHKADEFNASQNDNGLAMTGLKQLAEKHGWQFNQTLLEDIGKKPSDIMNTVDGSSKIKQYLAENNFKCLEGPTEVYFFDDIAKYLNYTRTTAKIPENIEFKTVWFDWYGICIDGSQEGPLQAIPANCSSGKHEA